MNKPEADCVVRKKNKKQQVKTAVYIPETSKDLRNVGFISMQQGN